MIDALGNRRAAWLETADPKIVAQKLAATVDLIASSLELFLVQTDGKPDKAAYLAPLTIDTCFEYIADTWRELGRDDRLTSARGAK